jgi:hypothetical protein
LLISEAKNISYATTHVPHKRIFTQQSKKEEKDANPLERKIVRDESKIIRTN